jgi:hypothetical protein
LERVKGIEPSYEAWEAAVLPLNYTRAPIDSSLRLTRLQRAFSAAGGAGAVDGQASPPSDRNPSMIRLLRTLASGVGRGSTRPATVASTGSLPPRAKSRR